MIVDANDPGRIGPPVGGFTDRSRWNFWFESEPKLTRFTHARIDASAPEHISTRMFVVGPIKESRHHETHQCRIGSSNNSFDHGGFCTEQRRWRCDRQRYDRCAGRDRRCRTIHDDGKR